MSSEAVHDVQYRSARKRHITQHTFWFVEPEEVVRRDRNHLAIDVNHLTFELLLLPFFHVNCEVNG